MKGCIATHTITAKRIGDIANMELDRVITYKAGVIVYQPIINFPTHETVGVESLFRIQCTMLTNLHGSMAYWLTQYNQPPHSEKFDHYCASLLLQALNREPDFPPSFITLNINHSSLFNKRLLNCIITIQKKLNSMGKYLIIELVEYSHPRRDINPLLYKLCLLGVRIAIDDFGTGYSSLKYAKHLVQVDLIKISFDGQDLDYVALLADTALDHFKHLTTEDIIVEKIDSQIKAHQVSSLGINLLQGYLFGKPSSHWLQHN
jgi:EAL domain-containing protein (putative c-di-GMP-specific phosphodiesterase class I)